MDSPPAAALTDDVVAEILFRLPDPADLVRASAACVSYRRLATDRAFLRRYRALHPAPLLGFLNHNGFHPAEPPHAAAPPARAVSLAADFSFSFLPSSPGSGPWILRDVRGGRALLDRAPEDAGNGRGGEGSSSAVFTEVAVCDPLHRRYVVLPPIPDDLAAAVDHPLRVGIDRWFEAFLVPPRADEAEESSFEVIWMAQSRAKLVAFAFSSATGQWRAVASVPWRDLTSGARVASRSPVVNYRQCAHGCFYLRGADKFLVLDARRMEFSVADVPSCHGRLIAIVEAGERSFGMFALRDQIADGEVSLHYLVRQEGSSHWQVEKIIPLDPAFKHYNRAATERYILLLRFPKDRSSAGVQDGIDLECFSMDVKNLQLEKVCGLKHHILYAYIYTNFPPSLSSPTV